MVEIVPVDHVMRRRQIIAEQKLLEMDWGARFERIEQSICELDADLRSLARSMLTLTSHVHALEGEPDDSFD